MLTNRFKVWFNQRSVSDIGISALIFAFVLAILGHYDTYGSFSLKQLFDDFYANFSAELASIALTILIIDRLNQSRDIRQEKERLIRNMSSHYNQTALQATDELHLLNWLEDGTLHHAYLNGANLRNANLIRADLSGAYLLGANLEGSGMNNANLHHAELLNANLKNTNLRGVNLENANLAGATLQGADLRDANLKHTNMVGVDLLGANLEGADITGAKLGHANLRRAVISEDQLKSAFSLKLATMPDNNRYNGKFNLQGDNIYAQHLFRLDLQSEEEMAAYLGITVKEFRYRTKSDDEYGVETEAIDPATLQVP